MARQTASEKTINLWISGYPELSFNGIDLTCNVCKVRLSTTRKSVVTQHVTSRSHKALTNVGGDVQKRFNLDLVKFMVGCNIPWDKLDNPLFREFVENCVGGEYSEVQLPKSSTLRTTYLPQVAEDVVSKICSELEGKYIWVSVDETTNACGWKIASILVGALDELHSTRSYLLASKVLESINADTISSLVHDSLKLLWKDRYAQNKDKFLLFITDTATNMKAAGRILQETYNVLHLTCVAHALDRVAETVRECYPKVDKLISSVQKVFVKAPDRTRLFSQILPNTPLPPTPALSRCGTWIEAATYYFVNFKDVKQVLEQFDSNQAVEISNAQKAVMDSTVHGNLREVHNFYSRIPLAIQQLERNSQSDDFSLFNQMNVIYDLRNYLSSVASVQSVKEKLENVLRSNPGFRTLCGIEKLLRKQEVDFAAPGIKESSLRHYLQFKYAPITSLDIERLFSLNKWIFSDRRRNLTPCHLEQILIIYLYYYSTAAVHE